VTNRSACIKCDCIHVAFSDGSLLAELVNVLTNVHPFSISRGNSTWRYLHCRFFFSQQVSYFSEHFQNARVSKCSHLELRAFSAFAYASDGS
jgi:hypothetical protein